MTTVPAPDAATRGPVLRWGLAGLAVALAAAAIVVSVSYHSDIADARARISRANSVMTPCGRIEYASAGNGAPVLVIHGAGGGFDQGETLGAPLAQAGFRVIAPSRFGYLGTPLPADA